MKSWQQPTTHHVSRRALLRGLGVTMALPWLESFSVWGDEPLKGRASTPPVRLAVLFAGNGFHSREWWAKGEGRAMELGKVLAPLEDFKDKLLFIRGLYNAEAGKGGIHSARPATCSPERPSKATAASAPASAWISCWPKSSATRPRCRAWCWAASRRSRPCTRATR